jgi:hypothetical protein
MDRDIDNYFEGIEVEHTPTHGMHTLFVVGVPDIIEIESKLEQTSSRINAIYFGANQSFNLDNNKSLYDAWDEWEKPIKHFLEKDYWCTLDLDISKIEALLDGGLTENRRFIPMISAKLPYIELLGYNAVLKLDDIDFDKSNPGVWCHKVHDLMDRKVFTGWDDYSDDKGIL